MSIKVNTIDFILRSNIVHNHKYTYDLTTYDSAKKKVIITCPYHGDFKQTPSNHLAGYGCNQCAIDNRADKKRKTLDQFINEAHKIHNNKYIYSTDQEYRGNHNKITITCKKHGNFFQSPASHLAGRGCPKCKGHNKNTADFTLQANSVHNNKYDYSLVKYITAKSKVKIKCSKHGEFLQTPDHHLNGEGCPKCKSSIGETLIETYLLTNKLSYVRQLKVLINSKNYFIDFMVMLDQKKYFVEYNGIQHYEYVPHFHRGGIADFTKQINRDNVIKQYCKDNNVILIELSYKLKQEQITTTLKQILC